MRAADQEIELKFALTPDAVAAIEARPDIAGRAVSRRLVSTYFDSAGHALLRAGYTLRVRHEDGRWVQTLKSCLAGDGAVRDEWSLPIRRGAPEIALLSCEPAVRAMAGAQPEAVFTVDVERRSAPLDAAGCRLEISLDHGEVRHAGASAPVMDVELELKAGRRSAFFSFVRDFRARHGLRPTFESKAARGFALLAGGDAPRRYASPRIRDDMTAGEAFKAAARAALTQIAGNAEALRASALATPPDPEVVHQLRVGLRRLRGLISVFKPVVNDSRTAAIRAGLRRVANALGPAREADVLLAGVCAQAPWGREGEAARRTFSRRLRADRKAAYALARDAVDDDAFSALLLETLIWIEAGPWTLGRASGAQLRDAPILPFASTALDRGYRRVMRRARHFATLDAEARHGLRIAAKKLRYATDVLGPLFAEHPKRRRRFIDLMKLALDALGELNDLAGHPPWGGRWPLPVIVWRDARRAHAEKASAKALRRLAAVKVFWPNA